MLNSLRLFLWNLRYVTISMPHPLSFAFEFVLFYLFRIELSLWSARCQVMHGLANERPWICCELTQFRTSFANAFDKKVVVLACTGVFPHTAQAFYQVSSEYCFSFNAFRYVILCNFLRLKRTTQFYLVMSAMFTPCSCCFMIKLMEPRPRNSLWIEKEP